MKPKFVIAVPGLCLLAVGCHRNNAAKPVAPPPPPMRTYAVIPSGSGDSYNSTIRAGAIAAASEAGNAQVLWAAPKHASAGEQIGIIRRLISKHVNGIAISCADADALQPEIDRAVAADIPVACFDSDSPDSKRAAFVGVDDRAVGRKMGELLKASLPQGGNVAVLTGGMDDEELNERIAGFKEAILGSKLILITVFPSSADPRQSAAIVRDYNREHPNIKGWGIVVGVPLDTPVPGPFRGAKPGDVKVVACDTSQPELEYVRKGYVTALVGRQYYEWGHTSVKLLDQLDHGMRVPPVVAENGLNVVTKDNVEAFARQAGGR